MTVKLAKLFSNSSNNTSSQVPPPLPPPNTQPPTYNYYNQDHHHMPQLQQKLQKPYNPYMDDAADDVDDEDNMSLYSTTASIMTARDHPFNNSQRPLLAERKPQLLLTQNKSNSNNNNNGNGSSSSSSSSNNKKKNQTTNQQNSQQTSSYQQQQHQLQLQQQQKSYISPYVQQQKRDSAKGLHGFNDFDILSQQYNQHLQSPHIGYPYGSPPSPTTTAAAATSTTAATSSSQNANLANNITSDFIFNSLATYSNHKQHQQQLPQQQQHQQQHHFASISTALTSTPRYGNINNYGSTTSANAANNTITSNGISPTTTTSTNTANSRPCYDINEADYYSNRPSADPPTTLLLGKSSRFEDDFCSRRNIDFTKNTHFDCGNELEQQQYQPLHNGPFIFGIPPEQQTDFPRMPHGGRSFGDISEDSGITKDDDKYSTKIMVSSRK